MKTLKGGISSFRYKKLNFFYKLYYKFMCFFNERFCIERNTTNPYNANKGKGITQKKHNGPNYIIPKTNANPYNANKGITQIHNIQGKPTRTNYSIQPKNLGNVFLHENNKHFNSLVERRNIKNLGNVANQNALIATQVLNGNLRK